MTLSFAKCLNIGLCLCVSVTLIAQKPTFFLAPKWSKGDARRFELTKGKHIVKNKTETTENESRQTVTVSVVEASAKGFLMSARYENTLNSPDAIDVRYVLSVQGEFQGIVNMPTVKESFNNLFDNLTAKASTTPSVLQTIDELRQFMTSDSYITNQVFQELALVHQFYNNLFTVDSLERYETQLPNTLNPNGDLIRAKATLLAKKEGDIGYIRHTVEPDMGFLNQQAKHLINRMTAAPSSKLSVNTPPVSLTDAALYDEDFCSFNVDTGWLAAFQRKRTILEGDVKTVEFVLMKEIH